MLNTNLETNIKVDGSIVSELSEKIPSNIVALNELIKNAYDAGSPEVQIVFDSKSSTLQVIDKGEGMSKADIDTLFHISKSIKKYGQFNPKYNRYIQGSKGLGFLSVFKFGRIVEWKTKKDVGYKFSVDFDELLKTDNLTDYKIKLTVDETISNGTEIIIKLSKESKQLLMSYFSEEKNYAKIINSFTDNNFLIVLKIDGKEFRSDHFEGINNHFKERQLFYVEYDSNYGVINYYHNDYLIKSVNYPFSSNEYKCKIALSIYKFKAGQKSEIYSLFYNSFNELTPLIFINDNLFNNFDLFDPSVMKTIKTGDMLNQMIGYVKLYSDNDNIQFNSDRTKFAQNLLTEEIIRFLKNINIKIQKVGSEIKKYLVDNDFLTCKKVDNKDVDLNDIESLKKFIYCDFAFRDYVNITVDGKFIEFSVFGKTSKIEIINGVQKINPALIQLSKVEDTHYIPSNQINLLDYISVAKDSTGNNIKEKIEILVDGIETKTCILESITEDKTICVEYLYNDVNTKLIKQKLTLHFKEKEVVLIGTYTNEDHLLFVKMEEGYKILFDSTVSKLINQINKLNLIENREVISCCIRVLFELSVKCLSQSNKQITIKSKLKDKVFEDIKTIIEFCQHKNIREEIAKNTKISFNTLGNIMIVEDFINAYKKSNLGPHAATAYLTDSDIKFIAQKAAYFMVFINEIITNSNIV